MDNSQIQQSRKSNYKLKRRIVVGLILGLGVLIMVGLIKSKPAPEKKPVENTIPLVEVATIAVESVVFTVKSQGIVSPLTETIVSAEVTGAVTSLSDALVAGGRFSAGDVLLRIDPVNYEVALERTEATMAQRQIEYDGAKRLGEQGYRSATELSSAKAALAAARADVVRAERDLERTVVRAPYDGLVRSRDTDLGNYVNVGTQLAVIFAIDIVEVRLPVPNLDLAFVDLPKVAGNRNGPNVTLLGNYRGRPAKWQGKVVRTEGVVDDRTRMTFAVARIDDPYLVNVDSGDGVELPVGTFVKAAIDGIQVDNIVKIPRELVRANNQVIFVNADSTLTFRNLDFLRTDDDFAYVTADQIVEDTLLLTRLETPLSGMKVRTNTDTAPATPVAIDSQDN